MSTPCFYWNHFVMVVLHVLQHTFVTMVNSTHFNEGLARRETLPMFTHNHTPSKYVPVLPRASILQKWGWDPHACAIAPWYDFGGVLSMLRIMCAFVIFTTEISKRIMEDTSSKGLQRTPPSSPRLAIFPYIFLFVYVYRFMMTAFKGAECLRSM